VLCVLCVVCVCVCVLCVCAVCMCICVMCVIARVVVCVCGVRMYVVVFGGQKGLQDYQHNTHHNNKKHSLHSHTAHTLSHSGRERHTHTRTHTHTHDGSQLLTSNVNIFWQQKSFSYKPTYFYCQIMFIPKVCVHVSFSMNMIFGNKICRGLWKWLLLSENAFVRRRFLL